MKRTCIKVLPSLLVIHLMRFGFDWESGRSIKYDEQIRVRKLFCVWGVCVCVYPCCLREWTSILPAFPHVLIQGF